MKQKMKLNGKIFHQYLRSYLLIFLLAFLLFSGLFAIFSYANTQHQMQTTSDKVASDFQEVIDEDIRKVRSVSHDIVSDTHTTPYKIQQNFPTIKVLELLNSHRNSHRLFSDILLHYKSSPWMFSTAGTATTDFTFQEKYPIPADEYEKLMALLQDKNVTTQDSLQQVKINGETKNFIVHSLQKNQVESYGSILYLLSDHYFKNLQDLVLGEREGSFVLIDQNKQVVFNHSSIADKQLLNALESKSNKSEKMTFGETEYIVSALPTQLDQMQIIAVLPTCQFYKPYVDVFLPTLLLLLAILAFGVGISYFVTLQKYQ